jgi:hypothetical protein
VRARRELHKLLKLLAVGNFEGALRAAPGGPLTPSDLETAAKSFVAERKALLVHHEARKAEFTTLKATGPATWDAFQTMVDPEGENDWVLEAEIDLSGAIDESAPLLRLRRVGPV